MAETNAWRLELRRQAAAVRLEVPPRMPPGAPADPDLVRGHLDAVEVILSDQGGDGAPAEAAWKALHDGQALLPLVVPQDALPLHLVDAQRRAGRRLPAGSPVRRAVESPRLAARVAKGKATTADRLVLHRAMSDAFEVGDSDHAQQRSWVRRIWFMFVVAVVALGAAVGFAYLFPVTMPLCAPHAAMAAQAVADGGSASDAATAVCPSGGTAPTGDDALTIAFLGALGACLVVIAAVRRSQPSTSPYSLTPALSALRIPFGGLTALIGILLLQSGAVPGIVGLATISQMAVYAVIFGFAQETVTRLLENRARDVDTGTAAPQAATQSAPNGSLVLPDEDLGDVLGGGGADGQDETGELEADESVDEPVDESVDEERDEERADDLGGDLDAGPLDDQGVEVDVVAPAAAAADDPDDSEETAQVVPTTTKPRARAARRRRTPVAPDPVRTDVVDDVPAGD
ncbi:hypothetical protein [Cellulomonas composti]|uniref:Uncharacterized protein n=1 Tax=Cellulomonas composti TaxID=266130 RepID=A0A511J9N4_9CELL|nr:hypothetical protein [Cellulomonas composti]GEL94706.1 hypothetical protein CCO02nite_13640 [Cellulomonas composti]